MENTYDFECEAVWRPSASDLKRANLTRFMRAHRIKDYAQLMRRSTRDIAWFSDAVIRFLDIQFYDPYTNVVDLSRGKPWPRWCAGGKMNIVHNCLDKYMGTKVESQIALIAESENGQIRVLTYQELYQQVNQAANALRSLGLQKGDAVGLFMPPTPEFAVALLAVAKIGGVILPLFSEFGAGAVESRLSDACARILITADGFIRNGAQVAMKPTADEAVKGISSIQYVIVLRNAGNLVEMLPGRDQWWDELVSAHQSSSGTMVTGAEDVLMILYNAGATSKPHGAVHTHCGFPVKAAQDMAFGIDLHPQDRIFWPTDMGSMMGPWLVFGTFLLAGTLILYDGGIDSPGLDRIWSLCERHHVNILGVTPTQIRALIPGGPEPVRSHDISSIMRFASTGEAWDLESWRWLFEVVGAGKKAVINYSGGSEVSGGILMDNPILPLKPCAFSSPCPGMAARVYSDAGKSVRRQVGELVIEEPWIGMTRGFWKDPQLYMKTYWSRWTDVWVHGDFAEIDEDGHWYILGRSDDTIMVGGIRLEPAQVESLLVSHPEVVEAVAIGVPHAITGSDVVVFCVSTVDPERYNPLRKQLGELLEKFLGIALAPREILFVSDFPRTRNAKVLRQVIRSVYLDQDPGDLPSLVNPDSIEEIRNAK